MENIALHFIWAALGLILIVVEMLTGTFILLSFGLAAFAVALLSFLVLNPAWAQIVLFAVFGLLILGVIKKRKGKENSESTFKNDQNRSFVLDSQMQNTILPGEEGTVSYQGSPWTAVNVGTQSLRAGQKVIITKTQGIKIFIKASEEA